MGHGLLSLVFQFIQTKKLVQRKEHCNLCNVLEVCIVVFIDVLIRPQEGPDRKKLEA